MKRKLSESDYRWPMIQRCVESVPLRCLIQYLPWRFFRRITHRFVPYPPGIYILAYHKIIDPEKTTEWEDSYAMGGVSLRNFEKQIAYLCRKMTPLSLTEAIKLMTCSIPDRPYFVVTFDDGYSDVFRNAAPVTDSYGLKPCLFVNGRFAQEHVYYRVLAALLTKNGYASELKDELMARDSNIEWSIDPQKLFAQTKNCYVAGIVEDAVETAYIRCIGDPAELGVHLKPNEIRKLSDSGWEIGNHTFDHRLLSRLDATQIAASISNNDAFWRNEGIPLIDVLAIPNGAVKDVNEHLEVWLQEHENIHALFCNGGINQKFNRTQWLRFFGGDGDELSLHEVICAEIDRMNLVWRQVSERGQTGIFHDRR